MSSPLQSGAFPENRDIQNMTTSECYSTSQIHEGATSWRLHVVGAVSPKLVAGKRLAISTHTSESEPDITHMSTLVYTLLDSAMLSVYIPIYPFEGTQGFHFNVHVPLDLVILHHGGNFPNPQTLNPKTQMKISMFFSIIPIPVSPIALWTSTLRAPSP